MKKRLLIAGLGAAVASLVLPGVASAANLEETAATLAEKTSELNMVWVAVACVLVFLMQAGFMFLEIGFSRQKNVGTGVAKILVNFAIVTIAWWAIGYGIAEGGDGQKACPAAILRRQRLLLPLRPDGRGRSGDRGNARC